MGGIYGTIVESIENYTGLSPTSFIILMAVSIITYKIVCTMFVAVDDYKSVEKMKEIFEEDMKREPVQLGEVTEEQLKEYDGSDPKKPLLMAIKGNIYDVSKGRIFYGPGGSYAMFAGRDATRALALMSFDPQDLTGNMDGLSESELDVLQDWELKFIEKYPKVGVLVKEEDLDSKKAV
ncbi:probable steroid-binding protein 3 [Chenopodium quinoa]|uniref:Cytochrome b5 heme-binding domain-containing protein n=1 Tax=Chenopodium quinoa TaxID=63459 RepID=A0A803LBY2_CHEQI|nr:probable steroid-binding protein 3 [Chenopodium quinoa]